MCLTSATWLHFDLFNKALPSLRTTIDETMKLDGGHQMPLVKNLSPSLRNPGSASTDVVVVVADDDDDGLCL